MRITGIMVILASSMLKMAKDGDWAVAYTALGVLIILAVVDVFWGPRYSYEKR